MTTARGGLNLALAAELVAAGADDLLLREEGYTAEETIRARVASSIGTTSETVSIGPEAPAKDSRTAIRQPRRGVATGPTPSGPTGALERSPGTAVAPRGGTAGHRHVETRARPG